MRIYICPMCNATLVKVNDTMNGKCPDCRCDYNLKGCGKIDRKPEPNCIEMSS